MVRALGNDGVVAEWWSARSLAVMIHNLSLTQVTLGGGGFYHMCMHVVEGKVDRPDHRWLVQGSLLLSTYIYIHMHACVHMYVHVHVSSPLYTCANT